MARKDAGECVKVGRSLNCPLEWKFLCLCARMVGIGCNVSALWIGMGSLHLMALAAADCGRGMGSECCEEVRKPRK